MEREGRWYMNTELPLGWGFQNIPSYSQPLRLGCLWPCHYLYWDPFLPLYLLSFLAFLLLFPSFVSIGYFRIFYYSVTEYCLLRHATWQSSLNDVSAMVPSGNHLPVLDHVPDQATSFNHWGSEPGTSASYHSIGIDNESGTGAGLGMGPIPLAAEESFFFPENEQFIPLGLSLCGLNSAINLHNDLVSKNPVNVQPPSTAMKPSCSDRYCCLLCPKWPLFASYNTFYRHYTSFHGRKTQHRCHIPGCAYTDSRADKIRDHQKGHAAEIPEHNHRLETEQLKTQMPTPEKCKICDKVVGSWRELMRCVANHCRVRGPTFPGSIGGSGGDGGSNNNGGGDGNGDVGSCGRGCHGLSPTKIKWQSALDRIWASMARIFMVAKVVGHLYNNALNRPRIPQRGLCQVMLKCCLSVLSPREMKHWEMLMGKRSREGHTQHYWTCSWREYNGQEKSQKLASLHNDCSESA